MFGQVAAPLARLARRRYTLTLLCDSDFPFVQDGTRRDAAFRDRQQDLYRQALQADAVDWPTLSGPPGQRLARALALVAAWTPG